MALQEVLDEEACLEEQILSLMHRFADRFINRRPEINRLNSLPDEPHIEYDSGKKACDGHFKIVEVEGERTLKLVRNSSNKADGNPLVNISAYCEIKDNGDVRVETENREDLRAVEHDETKVSDSGIKGVDCVQLDCDNGEFNGDDIRESQWFENYGVDVDNAASNGVNGPDHSVKKVTELMDNVVDGCILGNAIAEDPVSTHRVSNFIPNAVKKAVMNHAKPSLRKSRAGRLEREFPPFFHVILLAHCVESSTRPVSPTLKSQVFKLIQIKKEIVLVTRNEPFSVEERNSDGSYGASMNKQILSNDEFLRGKRRC
uniref:Uncharacterized protein n=1 Tax=Tanacetum cinerariifolium TaxID=118510 RepID=A0A6L2K152_TANCI|nr:hypothetical protein [Tanacetum cinerariifolium]